MGYRLVSPSVVDIPSGFVATYDQGVATSSLILGMVVNIASSVLELIFEICTCIKLIYLKKMAYDQATFKKNKNEIRLLGGFFK